MKKGAQKSPEEEIKVLDKHDVMQILIGAAILSVPVGFTEETWGLGETLPLTNIIFLIILAFAFLGIFTYFHYHKEHVHANPKYHLAELSKRILVTYLISFAIVSVVLSAIQVAPWITEPLLAFKRTAIVTFPSSMGAAISDLL